MVKISTAIDDHSESNTFLPVRREAIPALPFVGKILRKGVRFSVHTGSLGRALRKRCSWLFKGMFRSAESSGWNSVTGLVVDEESMKFKEAQKRPER